jgi:hypothetical protein
MNNSAPSSKTRATLLGKGLCRSLSPMDAVEERKRQLRSLERLRQTADSSTGPTQFLATYDILMRHAELWLLEENLAFGEQPHAALKLILQEFAIIPTGISQQDLVSLRHSVKKSSAPVTPRELNALRGVIEKFTAVSA